MNVLLFMDKLKVVELFAGVGGFRLGLEGYKGKSSTSFYKNYFNSNFEVIWSNQWEPSTVKQHASLVYENVFGKKGHSNEDIHNIKTSDIPDHDVLVGGFPCQDYSVATSLKNSKGLEGKKGVLWWQIERIISEKKNKPKFLILENVDRLLKSPTKQRGRDFAVMLKCLELQGYTVEWRVINSADYGFPQRRKRVYILGYHQTTDHYNLVKNNPLKWIQKTGTLFSGFPTNNFQNEILFEFQNKTVFEISQNFNLGSSISPFKDSGIMIEGKIYSFSSKPDYNGKRNFLKDIIYEFEIDKEFFVNKDEIYLWKYQKGSKTINRKTKDGHEYKFSEGKMAFPDDLEKPSRTIITGEGGKSPSRFKHIIQTKNGLRRLTPIELERLNGFPDNHTKLEGVSNTKRAFLMGNALVTGIIEIIGNKLAL